MTEKPEYESVSDEELKQLLDLVSGFAFKIMTNQITGLGGLTRGVKHEDGSTTVTMIPNEHEDVNISWTETPSGRIHFMEITPNGLEIPRLIIPAPTVMEEQVSIPAENFTMKLEE
mgnify:CR=1 FL=1|jgi:hypothetical protein